MTSLLSVLTYTQGYSGIIDGNLMHISFELLINSHNKKPFILVTRDEYTTVTAMTKFDEYFLSKKNLDYEIFQFQQAVQHW